MLDLATGACSLGVFSNPQLSLSATLHTQEANKVSSRGSSQDGRIGKMPVNLYARPVLWQAAGFQQVNSICGLPDSGRDCSSKQKVHHR